jgi:PEP-CTERM motif
MGTGVGLVGPLVGKSCIGNARTPEGFELRSRHQTLAVLQLERVGMKQEFGFSLGRVCVGFFLMLMVCGNALAGTRTVNFGWEDGSSTSDIMLDGSTVLPPIAISPDTGDVTLANVTTGEMLDRGPSSAPFAEPVSVPITPFGGNRMLEVTLSQLVQDSGTDAVVYLGLLTGLDAGDTYSFKFRAFDPTDGRSPSIPPNATYAVTSDVGGLDGFAVPLQTFLLGTGWLDTVLDVDGDAITQVNPDVIFDPATSNDGLADAVRLEADFFYQSLTAAAGASEKFYIDDLEISVTSDNPDAAIHLPNGTVVMVNETQTCTLAGDFDCSGGVENGDLTLLLNNWAQPASPVPAGWTGVPQPTDPAIDNDELTALLNGWGQTVGTGSSSVPEPGSVALVVVGLAGLWLGRRSLA